MVQRAATRKIEPGLLWLTSTKLTDRKQIQTSRLKEEPRDARRCSGDATGLFLYLLNNHVNA
jgi:hypothetical protein